MKNRVARWRKQPRETGLRSIGAAPRGYELRMGDDVILYVAPSGGNWALPLEGWYWVGMGQNTCRNLKATAEEAKAEADAYFKTHRHEVPDGRTEEEK